MEISSFSFPNADDFYFSPNAFTFSNDFDNSNAIKKHKANGEDFNNSLYTQNHDNIDISLSFEDIINHLFSTETDPVTDQALQPDATNQTSQITSESPTRTNSNKRARPGSEETMVMPDESSSPGGSVSQRRMWVKNRSKAWWEQRESPDFPEEQFKKEFRMSRATFDLICKQLEPFVNKKDTMLRVAIPVRQRVAACLWRLATGEPLRDVGDKFGLGTSTCHKLVIEVCRAIKEALKPEYIQWPNENRVDQIKEDFELSSGIPNVCGSLYTTHVPTIAPKEKAAAYFNKRHTERNQKTSYSVSVQGVVDSKGVFTDVSIGWPGSMSDEKVLEKSSIFQRAGHGLMKDLTLVGNRGHPLMDWVLAPYTRPNLTWTQNTFNDKVGDVQGVAKEAFMRLKARWSCLQKRTEMKLQEFPVVLMACCVLHNICELNGEGFSPELKFELFDDEVVAENGVRSLNAQQYRDQIAHKLLHHCRH